MYLELDSLRRLVYDFQMTFPLKLNASMSLEVDIHLHEFFLGDRHRKCWTYLTTGLAKCGQKEMSLSLLLEEDDDENEFPKTPMKIFRLLEKYARDGKTVDIADATKLGKTGLFGFTALYYLPAIHYEGLPDCDNYLALMLVHQTEYEFAKRYGFTRLLSRIGKFCSSFPYPTWNSRRRPALFTPDHQEDSVLNEINLLTLKGIQAELVDHVVLLTLQASDKHRLAQHLDLLAAVNKSFALQTILPLAANACLYWEPGQSGPGAYTAPDEVTRIGAAFIMFEAAEISSSHLLEDGFLFSLSRQTLARLRASCEPASDSGILELSGMSLSLSWHQGNADDQRPTIRYQHQAGWTELANSANIEKPVDRPADKIRLKSITDISANASDKVNSEHMRHYVETIQTFLLSSMLEETEELNLTIRVEIQNNTATYEISADIGLNPEFIAFVTQGLAQLRPCQASVPVIFDLVFAINS